MIEVKVPGKLFIAGEYAILEPGHEAIVIAVDRFVKVTVQKSNNNELSLPQIGYPSVRWKWKNGQVHLDEDSRRLAFTKSALQVAIKFLTEQGEKIIENFSLTIDSQLDDGLGKKFGLGSSAAIVVGIISALLQLHQVSVKKDGLFKLASIAHYKTQGNGSCADIAASVFGGWIRYSSFRPEWLLKELEEGTTLTELVQKPWPYLVIQPLPQPDFLVLCIGWTKMSAKTGPMVAKVQQLKTTDPESYRTFLKESKEAVALTIEGFYQKNIDLVIEGLTNNRLALKKLGEKAREKIETPQLTTLIDIANRYGSGKSSGAGGGDCGIAILSDKKYRPKLEEEWKEAGIEPLNLKVSTIGTERVR